MADTPDGFVPVSLFEAANQHVLEQGVYHNQLIGTINNQGAVIQRQQAHIAKLNRDLAEAQAALALRASEIAELYRAVYGAAEGV